MSHAPTPQTLSEKGDKLDQAEGPKPRVEQIFDSCIPVLESFEFLQTAVGVDGDNRSAPVFVELFQTFIGRNLRRLDQRLAADADALQTVRELSLDEPPPKMPSWPEYVQAVAFDLYWAVLHELNPVAALAASGSDRVSDLPPIGEQWPDIRPTLDGMLELDLERIDDVLTRQFVRWNAGQPQLPEKRSKSRQSSDNRDKSLTLISALNSHHGYEPDGTVTNFDPMSLKDLAQGARTAKSTASTFMAKYFNGARSYRLLCRTGHLAEQLQKLNAELEERFAPLDGGSGFGHLLASSSNEQKNRNS